MSKISPPKPPADAHMTVYLNGTWALDATIDGILHRWRYTPDGKLQSYHNYRFGDFAGYDYFVGRTQQEAHG